ncbi:MAG TPA: hypothetical protein VM101_12225 [Flavitalea sp.]|nr:hypothetical protein [Flavitalea sp.]
MITRILIITAYTFCQEKYDSWLLWCDGGGYSREPGIYCSNT